MGADVMSDEEKPPPSSSSSDADLGVAGNHCHAPPCADQVLENVLESVLCFLTDRRDRNAAALVCKAWYRVEAMTRSEVFIGNCYAVSPGRVARRFGRVKSLSIKGKPRFADFSLLPPDWGAYLAPWVATMVEACRGLEKMYLKRMLVTDNDLVVLARSFPNFKELVLVCCEGFGTSGLSVVASQCRQIKVLDLLECEVVDNEVDWFSCFPKDKTHLESLIFDCVDCEVNFKALEQLVARSPSLKKLGLNRFVSPEQLYRIIVRAPQLTHLGTGAYGPSEILAMVEHEPDYASAFAACKSLVSLSGFRDFSPDHLRAIYPICANLTSLNFSYASIYYEQVIEIISHCHKLQVFWVLDSVCDEGLKAVAATCRDLRELRVFPVNAQEAAEGPVSEVGLLAISEGCRKLQSILYFCQKMTNAAVVAMSKNCPDLMVFRLCIMGRHRPDYLTGKPMDEGFGAIVKNCKKLTRLALSGLLTDQAFSYIGQYGKSLRTLSVAFAGGSDTGLKHVLDGCPKLQKLEVRDSPFGDLALRAGLHHFYKMRFLWMSSCKASRQCCEKIARELPHLAVEVIDRDDEGTNSNDVDTLYMYRSLDGPRTDAPKFVHIL